MSALRGIGIAWLGVMLCGLPPSLTAAAAPAAPPQRAVVLNAPPPPKRTPSGTMATPGSVALGAIAARAPRGPGRVVLPDHVFVRSPRTFRPFTIREFLTADQYAASVQNKKPPTVTLRRGGTITIDERYVNKINELERDFNQLGYSLRDAPSPAPIPLQSSTLALGTTPDREPTPISGPLAQFAGYNWSKTVGLPSIAALKLHEEMVAVNSPDSLGTDIGASVIVTLLGTDHTVVDLSARSVVPISGAIVDPLRQATIHCVVGVDCGSPSKTGTAPGLLSVADNLARFDINQKLGIPPIQQTFNTFIGPVPVTVKVGLRSLLGLQLTATADVRDGTASLGPSLSTFMFAQGGLGYESNGFGIYVEAGAEILLLRYTIDSKSSIHIDDMPTRIDETWQRSYGRKYEAFSGDLFVIGSIELPLIGTHSFKWDLVGFDPIVFESPQVAVTQVVSRPKQCKGNNKSMCASGCSDLASDVQNCGGCDVVCPFPNASCSAGRCACTPSCAGVARGNLDGCGRPCNCDPQVVFQHTYTKESFWGVKEDIPVPQATTPCGAGFHRLSCDARKTNNTPSGHSHCEARWANNDPNSCACVAHLGAKSGATIVCEVTVTKKADNCP